MINQNKNSNKSLHFATTARLQDVGARRPLPPRQMSPARLRLTTGYDHGYARSVKTAISIPDQVFETAETLAHRLGVSRGERYAKAVEAFIEQHGNQGVTARLNEFIRRKVTSLMTNTTRSSSAPWAGKIGSDER